MIRLIVLVLLLFLIPCAAVVQAQEKDTSQVSLPSGDTPVPKQNILPRFGGRAVIMDIDARILDDGVITWSETNKKTTIPGRPVEIKLIGENLVVVVRFTFIQANNGGQKLLVAQGQVWINDPKQGTRYQASVQTIPLEFGEPIYYFPLGPLKSDNNASIQVILTLRPYEEKGSGTGE
jgi:hypothetical protein